MLIVGALLAAVLSLPRADSVIESAIANHKTPGGVLWVEKQGKVYTRAYGLRAIVPHDEATTEDTIYDAASLTKVIATAPSIWILIERGRIALDDPVQRYIPEFRHRDITIRHLLTHTSALSPDPPRDFEWSGYETGLKLCLQDEPTNRPGVIFRYSDINFILLGEVVRRVSGEPLNVFAEHNIFKPLGMKDTTFLPKASPRIAPTEFGLRGVVHDPTARRMGGVAGHAGLFTTAHDVAIYLRTLLKGGAPIMKAATVRAMTSLATESAIGRTAGWDMDSAYSRPRIGGAHSFGHTGWTGGFLWLDPDTKSFYVFLSNRVHPDGKGSVTRLQLDLAAAIAESTCTSCEFPNEVRFVAGGANAKNGIDVLEGNRWDILRGHRVGLITNVSGIDRAGNPTLELLRSAMGVRLVTLFTPEHGYGALSPVNWKGRAGEGNSVVSLYDTQRKPTQDQLKDIDTLVFDIQDIGTRFYTYISTMELAMEAAAEAHVRFVVLDRLNPIGGEIVEGPVLEGKTDFVGIHDIAIRHGMTVGELAKMFREEKHIDVELVVVPVSGWKREMFQDEAGVPWVNPSPNMRSLNAATLYPGIGLLESSISVGRGTPTPFEIIGAPYIDGAQLAAALHVQGLSFTPVRFTPASDIFAGQSCGGLKITITDCHALRSVAAGLTIAETLARLYPDKFDAAKMQRLLRGNGPLEPFLARRAKYLMY